MTEFARASLIFTSFKDVPSSVCVDPQVFELVHFFQRFSIHPYVDRWSWLDAVDENFAFVRADFHAVTSRSFLQSFSELEFFFTAFQQINVVSKVQVAKRSSSDGQ